MSFYQSGTIKRILINHGESSDGDKSGAFPGAKHNGLSKKYVDDAAMDAKCIRVL